MSEEGTKLRAFRLPIDLSHRLDDRATLEDKTVTDIVVKALENLLSTPSNNESQVVRLTRQLRQTEAEVAALEREEVYTDALKKLEIIAITNITWFSDVGQLPFQEAQLHPTIKGSIRRRDYDEWVKDKAVYEKIVSDYDHRIRQLKDKVAGLKAQIVKTDVAKSS